MNGHIDTLKIGNRYMFYEDDKTYRGKLLETRIIPSPFPYIPSFHYIYISCNNIIKIMYIDKIKKAETLSQILGNKSKLPDDVLSIIDEFF
jgi:hypothetical protein